MDINIVLSLILTVLTVICVSDIPGNEGALWWRNNVYRVTDSMCGQEVYLPRRFKHKIHLLYDETILNDSCIIHINTRDSRWSSGICVESHVVTFKYDNRKRKVFKLYFGDFPFKNASHFYTLPDLLEQVCSQHTSVHAIFNASECMKFQLTVSRSKRFSKRSSESSPWTDWSSCSSWSRSNSWSSWDSRFSRTRSPWTSWNSWSATPSWRSDYDRYEREKAERKEQSARNGVIVLAVLGSLFVFVCCVAVIAWANFRRSLSNDENQQPVQSTEPDPSHLPDSRPMTSAPPEYANLMSGTNALDTGDTNRGHDAGYIDGYQVQTPFLTSNTNENVEIRRQQISSDTVPTIESPENAQHEIPPPSYSSLFASDNYQQHSVA